MHHESRNPLTHKPQDIWEKINLVDMNPEITRELLLILEEWRKNTGAPVPTDLNPDYVPTF